MEDGVYDAKLQRRTKGLVVRAHGDETLVLDRHSLETVHCLPADVTRVWDACTGRKTLAEIASAAGVDEPAAAIAVGQLMELDLLELPAGFDRRKFLQRSALVGAGVAAASGIESIVSSPAWAQGSPSLTFSAPSSRPPSPPSCPMMGMGPGPWTILFTMAGFAAGQSFTLMVSVPATRETVSTSATTNSSGAASGMFMLRMMVASPVTFTVTVTNAAGTIVKMVTVTLMCGGSVTGDPPPASPATTGSAGPPTDGAAGSPSPTPATTPSPTITPTASSSSATP